MALYMSKWAYNPTYRGYNSTYRRITSRGPPCDCLGFIGDYNYPVTWVHPLKLTANAPENRPLEKEIPSLETTIFRGENVSFREGN